MIREKNIQDSRNELHQTAEKFSKNAAKNPVKIEKYIFFSPKTKITSLKARKSFNTI